LDNKFEVGLTYIKPTGLTPAISRLLAGIACRLQCAIARHALRVAYTRQSRPTQWPKITRLERENPLDLWLGTAPAAIYFVKA
jgi:hypothetical protein